MNILSDIDDVLYKWGTEFGSLFTNESLSEDQLKFCADIAAVNRQREETMDQDNGSIINCLFTVNEVRKVVMKGKNGKAPGLDGIIHKVLKKMMSA